MSQRPQRWSIGKGWVGASGLEARESYKTLNYPLAASWCVRKVRMAAERSHEGLDEAKMTLTFYSISFYFIVEKKSLT